MISSTKEKNGLQITIIVHPSSSKPRINVIDGMLHVYVSSPPKDGKANRDAIRLLKKEIGAPIEIQHGKKSKRKIILLRGLDTPDLETFLERIQT